MTIVDARAGTEPSRPPPRDGSVLRLAIAMRGGVSLAVWIGGALGEIDRVRRANAGDELVGLLLDVTRFDRLEVDILAGASAGGLNAALGGTAIACNKPMSLRDVWLKTASLDRLLEPSVGAEKRRSILNGDYFEQRIVRELDRLLDDRVGKNSPPVEILLAATVFGGVVVSEPDDTQFSDLRREAHFHARHLADAAAFSDLTGRVDASKRLGLAARSTASFPGAFEPVRFPAEMARGLLRLPKRGAERPRDPSPDTRLYDGGIVDNIPVARAIGAAAAAPAQDAIRRWVVFLHPSPTLGAASSESASEDGPSLVSVVKDLAGGVGAETLLDDLEVLRRHNRESASYRLQRLSLCKAALAGDVAAYDSATPSVDADHLFALLLDPTAMLGWIPIGEEPPPSPIAACDESQRFVIRMEFLAALDDKPSVRPFARVVRQAHLMIEWIRWSEGRRSVVLSDLRRQTYDVLAVAQLIDAALDRAFLNAPENRVGALRAKLDDTRISADLHHLVDRLDAAASTAGPAWLPLRSRLDDTAAKATLDSLALGDLPTTPGSGDPLEERLLGRLVDVAMTLLAAAPQLGPYASVWRLLHDELGARPRRCKTRDALVTIDHACAGLHRGRAAGAPISLSYQRISGALTTPLAKGSSFPADFLPRFERIVEEDGSIEPKSKLAGNVLANFGAFVAQRFRVNDWMWGRVDAVAGMVQMFVRPEHLAPGDVGVGLDERLSQLVKSVQAVVRSPFARVTDVDARRSAEIVCRALWSDERENEVRAELLDALRGDDEAPLRQTRALLTVRWQLEILLEELPALFRSEVHPGGPTETPPPLVAPSDADDGETATANLRRLFTAYERTTRTVSEVWGDRRTTALGVRAARAVARALVPRDGVIASAGRTMLAAPLMIATAAILARGAFLVGASLLIDVVLVPRLNQSAQFAVVGAGIVVSLLFWWLMVRRERGAWRGWLALAGVVACKAFAVGALVSDKVPFAPPDQFSGAKAFSVPDGFQDDVLCSAVVVGVATALAAVLLWNWARPGWIVFVSLLSGAALGTWVILGAWRATGDLSLGHDLLRLLGSMWVPAGALLVVTTLISVTLRPEDRPVPPPLED